MSVVVIATLVPLLEEREAVVAAMERTIARVHVEDAGCQLYALHEADHRLVMVEKWADQAALDTHNQGRAVAELRTAIAGKLSAPPDVVVLAPHPAGTLQQGTV